MASPDRLLADLDELIGLLERHGEDHWARRLRASRRHLAAGDAFGVHHLLEAFGGSGSLDDLIFSRLNGHRVGDAESQQLTQRLDLLRGRLHTEATTLLRTLRSGG